MLLRRTRLGLLAAREVVARRGTLERVAGALGAELGWDAARRAAEIDGFLRRGGGRGDRAWSWWPA